MISLKRLYFLVAVLIAISATLFIAFPIAQLGTENLRIIDAINTDEGDLLALIMHIFRENSFNLGSSPYGILYYNLCLASAYVLSWFTEVTHTHVIIITRFISYFFLLGSAALIAAYVKRFKMGEWGIAFVLTLLASEVLIRYGLMLHPDSIQMFFIVGGIYFISHFLETGKWKGFILSIICAALAFSSKYSGLLLFPLIGLSVLVKYQDLKNKLPVKKAIAFNIIGSALVFIAVELFYGSSFSRHLDKISSLPFILQTAKIGSAFLFIFHLAVAFSPKLKQFSWVHFIVFVVSSGYTIILVFLLAFLVAAPQGFIGIQFIDSFLIVIGGHAEGHWFRETENKWAWFEVLSQNIVIPYVWYILSFVGLVILTVKSKWSRQNWYTPKWLPFYWIVLFMLVVLKGVGSKFSHFLIPIIPFFFIYVAYAFSEIVDYLTNKWIADQRLQIKFFSFLILGGSLLFQGFNFKKEKVVEFENSPRIAVGNWFNENIDNPIFILADKYVYIPNNENLKYRTNFGLTTGLIEELNPDYLAITYDIYSRFTDSSRVGDYLHGHELFMDRTRLYNQLLANTQNDYELIKNFGKNKIYKRR